jgi:hypothetical protein
VQIWQILFIVLYGAKTDRLEWRILEILLY